MERRGMVWLGRNLALGYYDGGDSLIFLLLEIPHSRIFCIHKGVYELNVLFICP